MKKFTLILSILFLISVIGIFSYSLYLNTSSKNKITELKKEIIENQEINKNNEISKENLEKEYEKLNEELKEEVSEYNLWLKVKEKITK